MKIEEQANNFECEYFQTYLLEHNIKAVCTWEKRRMYSFEGSALSLYNLLKEHWGIVESECLFHAAVREWLKINGFPEISLDEIPIDHFDTTQLIKRNEFLKDL
jgi:hypothetical protein